MNENPVVRERERYNISWGLGATEPCALRLKLLIMMMLTTLHFEVQLG